jgi:hypothetical protein
MLQHSKTHVGHGLSRFLVIYLVALFGVLMLVHAMQPQREGPGSSSRSPVHQDRQGTAKQAAIKVVVCRTAIG